MMQTQQYASFKDEEMVFDGNTYDGCSFEKCTLYFNGGEPPRFSDCTFISCNWRLGEIPMNVVKFMASLKHSGTTSLVDILVGAILGIRELPDAPLN